MYNVIVYIPDSHLEIVKDAIFKEGAGKLKGYDMCCWQVKGMGQFRASDVNKPFVGEINELYKLDEWRVEFIVEEANIDNVIKAMKKTHPYEVVAYSVIKLEEF